MKRLLKTALQSQHRWLLGVALLSIVCVILSSQLEVLSLGIITRKDVTQTNDVISRVSTFINGYIPIQDSLFYLAIYIILVGLFKAITLFSHRFTTRLIAIRISRDLRQAYFEHIQSLPMSFYQKHNMGSLSSRVVGDAALIAEAINACLVNYVQTPFTVITTLTLCFLTSWQLSLVVFLGFPVIVFPIVFIAKRVKRISRQIQQNQEKFSAALIEFLNGVQTVKMFAMEDFSLKKYQERNQRMAMLEQKSARYDLASRPIVHTIGMFFLATALLYGLYILQLSVSEVLVYCGLLYAFYEPIKKFAEENSHIQRGISAAERMHEVMDLKPQIEDLPHTVAITEFNDSIVFDNVWFRYEDSWALKGLSFTVSKGETVAIVGPTGAGKSTIVQLLPRLYDPEKGDIRIDGKSLRDYTQRSLREMIAFVPQRPFLFLDTVAHNISFGRAYTNEQIQAAARRAHAEEFILQMPCGYDTDLAETGKNLSGGQQQRLAIARALVKESPVLVLDEATSSLDSVSEHRIQSAIRSLRGSITQIIIAHRLSTVEDADKIIYIDKGEKVAEGTLQELLRDCAGFQQMWSLMQSKQKE